MLKEILQCKRREIAFLKERIPLSFWEKKLEKGNFLFFKTLQKRPWSLIAECKLASPSKGRLCIGPAVEDLAKMYEENGAAALSVLTDRFFHGRPDDIVSLRQRTALPILCKDFIVDDYQIIQARALGANVVLLIAAVLSDQELQAHYSLAESLGLDCLVEVHTLEELQRVQKFSMPIIGLNNRNLKTFVTDVKNTLALLPHCDRDRLIISESGIHSQEDALKVKAAGARGILVGEGLVTAPSIGEKVRELAFIK